MGVCDCSLFCRMLLNVHSSIAIILMGKRELIALLDLSSWCLVVVERLFLTVPRGCLQFVIVVFPDHTHLLFLVALLTLLLVFLNILRKTIEGYLDSFPSLIFNTIKTKLIIHAFHSYRYLQSTECLKGTTTLMITMFNMKDHNKP